MKRLKLTTIVLLTGIFLFGCAGGRYAGSSVPKESCVFIDKDGNLSSIIVEPYNAEDEDPEGLKSFAQAAVVEYNTQKGAGSAAENTEGAGRLPVALQSSKMEEGTAVLIFDFAAPRDLIDFSMTQQDLVAGSITGIELGTVADGLPEGKTSDGFFISAKNGSAVSSQEVTRKNTNKLITITGEGTLRTEGKIVYMTKGVSVVDDYTVKTPEGKSYIISK